MREIGTIVRSLGLCPTEAQLQEILRDVQDPQQPLGYVHLDRFLPVVGKIKQQQKYRPVSPDLLLKAFSVLDGDNRGVLQADEVKRLLSEQGEPFANDEVEEFINAAVDPATRTIDYKAFVDHLAVDDDAVI